MSAAPVYRKKITRPDGLVIEAVVWRVAPPVAGCTHPFKYRLYAGRDGRCVVRYDNERGKGDHKHLGLVEVAYAFRSLDQLMADFSADVNRLGGHDGESGD
jgi:hypothetical protein